MGTGSAHLSYFRYEGGKMGRHDSTTDQLSPHSNTNRPISLNGQRDQFIYVSSSPSQIPMENFKAADVEFQARFRHENIAELYGALFWDQVVHLFMEAGEGGSVLEKLDSYGPMREFEIIWVTKQILRGLEYLHSHKVIHHDIKRKCKKKKKRFSHLLLCT